MHGCDSSAESRTSEVWTERGHGEVNHYLIQLRTAHKYLDSTGTYTESERMASSDEGTMTSKPTIMPYLFRERKVNDQKID